MEKSFDEIMNDTKENYELGMKAGQKMILNSLLDDIRTFDYTTISDVKGAINNHLERLGDNNETTKV